MSVCMCVRVCVHMRVWGLGGLGEDRSWWYQVEKRGCTIRIGIKIQRDRGRGIKIVCMRAYVCVCVCVCVCV